MHAKGHIRGAFCDWIDAVNAGDAALTDNEPHLNVDGISIPHVLSKLYHCTDIMPWCYCKMLGEMLGLPPGSTYAKAVRAIRQERSCV